ncbi:MAG: MaoC family dehydratase [Myxococcota bacterium]
MEKIQFDDIDALRKHVSDEFGPWGAETLVSQKMINEFAEVTGDHQWIHLDEERCKKESPFGTTIAHGFLTLSLLPKLSAGTNADFAIVGAGNVTNYGADGFRFLSPVPAGSTLHARSRLKAVEQTPKGTRVAQETAIHVVGSERPALVYEGITLFQAPRG